jgi:succinate-semialdehyde dehydrogenase/glutarate-semialdehyde dehydrogenase
MADYPDPLQYLDGEWLPGADGASSPVLNPSDGTVLAKLRHVSAAQLDRALAAAGTAARTWRDTPASERARVLHAAADWLRDSTEDTARLLSLEEGKPLRESRAEVQASASILDWYAEEGRRAYGRVIPGEPGERLLVVAEPIGPVAAFTPWNFPLTSSVRKLGGALAAGCTIIVKTSEETPASGMALFRALEAGGLPRGVAQLVLGDPAAISSRLLASPVIRKLSLTGSTAVGRALSHLAVDRDIVTTMELGGNAPVIVCRDIDVEPVARALATAKFRNSGQVCNVPSRFLVHADVYERFVAALAAFAGRLVVGAATDPATEMGPLASERRFRSMQPLVDDAVARGATVRAGGHALDRPGFFFAPTVLADVPDDAAVVADEAFGPVIPASSFTSLDEAIARANDSQYGLASFVFTSSLRDATFLSDRLEAGMVGVNTTVISRTETPFGGIKSSGHGRESGTEGIESYLNRKTILQHDPITEDARQ